MMIQHGWAPLIPGDLDLVTHTLSALRLFSANEEAATALHCDCDAADRKPMSLPARRESPGG